MNGYFNKGKLDINFSMAQSSQRKPDSSSQNELNCP